MATRTFKDRAAIFQPTYSFFLLCQSDETRRKTESTRQRTLVKLTSSLATKNIDKLTAMQARESKIIASFTGRA